MVCDWTTGGVLDRSQPHPPLSPMPANRPASAVLGQVSREAPDIQSLKQRWSPESPHQRGRGINTGINYNSSLRPSTPWLVTLSPLLSRLCKEMFVRFVESCCRLLPPRDSQFACWPHFPQPWEQERNSEILPFQTPALLWLHSGLSSSLQLTVTIHRRPSLTINTAWPW